MLRWIFKLSGPVPGAGRGPEGWRPAFYCLLPILAWLSWWLAFYPGLMNADSLTAWGEAMRGVFNETQTGFLPIVYAWLMKLWDSPGLIGLIQIGSAALALWYFLRVLSGLGAPAWMLGGLALYFAFFPMIGASLITLIKDVPAGILFLFLFSFTLRIIESNGQWLQSRIHGLVLACTLALLCLVRLEGWVPAAAFMAGQGWYYRGFWRRIGGVLLLSAALVFLVRGPLYAFYGVKRTAYEQTVRMQCAQLAVIYNNHGRLAPRQTEFMYQLAPAEVWTQWYSPYVQNGVVFSPRFNLERAYEQRRELTRVWREAVQANWGLLLQSRVKMGAIVWRILEPVKGYTYAVHVVAVPAGIDDNTAGLHLTHPLPAWEQTLRKVLQLTSPRACNWFFYRPAFQLYVIGLSVALLVVRFQRWPALLLAVPLVAQALLIGLLAIGQESRFLFADFLIMPCLLAYAVVLILNRHRPGAGSPHSEINV